MKRKLIILELLGGFFGWVCIVAGLAAIYCVYDALVNNAPWANVFWAVGIGFAGKRLAAVFEGNKMRLDYIDQLMERGHNQHDATQAWLTASNGGANLLLDLQQADQKLITKDLV